MNRSEQELRTELEERLRFETLIADLSSKFVNIPVAAVDDEIRDAMRRVGESQDVDFSALWQWSDETPGFFTLTHHYSAQEGLQLPERMNAQESFPWVQQQMLAGRVVAIASLMELPAEAARDRESGRQLGIKSNLTIPLSVGGGPPIGALAFNTTRAERDWPVVLVKRLQLVAQIFVHALFQSRLRGDLEDRLRFETLISDLSARMIMAPAAETDREIERSLDSLLQFFRCDRCGLLEVIPKQNLVRITHARYAPGVEPVSKELNLAVPFPWAVPKLIGLGQHVCFSSLKELPPEAAVDRASWAQMDTKSSLNIPIFSGGVVRHLMVIHSIREERQWPESYIPRLRLLGEIFSSAVERHRAAEALRESEERLSLATTAAEVGLWILDYRANVFWASAEARAIFGYAPDEPLSLERFSASVHPDDWPLVQESLARSRQAGQSVNVEYRIRLGDGRERWIASRGRNQAASAGGPDRLMGVSLDITERKRIESALRASEARLAAGTDLAGLGYHEVDYGARTCFLDERLRQICGVPAELKQGLEPVAFWLEHVHPEDRLGMLEERQDLHEGKVGQVSLEYRYLHPVFGLRWLHHLARVAGRDPDTGGVRTIGVIRDITEHKRVVEQQAEDLRFVTLIADLSSRFINLPASEVDREILEAERRICEALDLDVAAFWQWVDEAQCFVLTTSYSAQAGPLLPDQSNAVRFFPWYQEQIRKGRIVAISSLEELPPAAAADRELCRQLGIKSNLSLPLSVAGEPALGLLGLNTTRQERAWPDELVKRMQLVGQIFANALARKRSEQQLRESEEVNRATFEQAAVGLAHVGTDGRWVRVNDKLCAIVGYSRAELMQLTFQDITHPEDLETDLEYVRQILSGEIKTYSMEKRYVRKDRSLVWVNLAVSLVRTAAGKPKHFISVVEDITERKRAEEEMQRLRLQLWHADRVAQTGAITASLAHELNQPLTGILSTAQAGLRFMVGGNADPGLIHEMLTNIVHDTKRAGGVINGLRAMLRHKETRREPIDLTDTIQGVLDLMHSEMIGRQVEVRQHLEPDFTVLADKGQIQQVLLNLLMNALEAMQEQPVEQRQLELTLARAQTNEVRVSLRDSGPGIPAEHQDKLFEAFWTTKQQGMGIGLAVSRSIIESHGGRLAFRSNSDRGATFYFTLPLATLPRSARSTASPAADPANP